MDNQLNVMLILLLCVYVYAIVGTAQQVESDMYVLLTIRQESYLLEHPNALDEK